MPVSAEPSAPKPPEDSSATLGLLPYLTKHALDDDYQDRHDREGGDAAQGRSSAVMLTAIALALFAILLVTAASQTSANAVSDAHEREALTKQIKQRQAAVNQQNAHATQLQNKINALENGLVSRGKIDAGTRARLRRLGIDAATIPVTGEGITVVVDNAPHTNNPRAQVLDTDLQQLVNGLWQAGAEAISIDGQRISSLSSIREAGDAITVNYRSLDRPYVVDAIGDPSTLPARFAQTESGATWLDLHQQLGLVLTIRIEDSLRLPGIGTPMLHYATSTKEEKR